MKKTIFILTHDYWHHSETIQPIVPLLFDEDDNVIYETDPAALYRCDPDLMISFKDPIENDQIPTPVWCDEKWTGEFLKKLESGVGFIGVHAALTDLPDEHPIKKDIIRSQFLSHPDQCMVRMIPNSAHEIMTGVGAFEFPQKDEQYFMEMLPQADTTVLAYTESVNGRCPGVWVHTYKKARICCITPGHSTANLTCPSFIRLLSNAVKWCMRDK